MPKRVSGAMSAMKSNFSYNIVPSSTTLTYEGILNSSYFKINSRENKKTLNMEISLASLKNPLTLEKEIWLGILLKSKYDGQKINELIDLYFIFNVRRTN